MTAGPPEILDLVGAANWPADEWIQVGVVKVACCGKVVTYSTGGFGEKGKNYQIAIGVRPVCKTNLGCVSLVSVREQFSIEVFSDVSSSSVGDPKKLILGDLSR